MKKCVFLFLLLFMSRNVFAECSYEQQAKLNSEASTIKAIYEEEIGYLDSSNYVCADGQEECDNEYAYFKVSILNLSKNFYIKVSEGNNTIKTITFDSVENGLAYFNVDNIEETHTYKFDIYTSDNTECSSSLNRSFYLTTPRINEYASYSICNDIPDFYLCQKYVTFEDSGFSDFVEKVEEYKNEENEKEQEKNKSFFEKLKDFIKDYKIAISISAIIIIGLIVGFIIIKQKRRKDII